MIAGGAVKFLRLRALLFEILRFASGVLQRKWRLAGGPAVKCETGGQMVKPAVKCETGGQLRGASVNTNILWKIKIKTV